MPTNLDRPDAHTPAVARHDAVHCPQSGLDDASLRLSGPYAESLAEAIESVANTVSELASIELLALTGVETATVVVHGSRTATHNTGWMTNGGSSPNRAVGGPELAAILDDRLPGWYGIERGTLVLDPIGIAAVPTSRLVSVDETSSVSALESILRSVLRYNHNRDVPTVCQLLFRPVSPGEFRVTGRVAEVSPTRRPLGRHGHSTSIKTPPDCPIDHMSPDSITSSRRLADTHWEGRFGMHSDGRSGLFTSDDVGDTNRLDAHVSVSQQELVSLRLRDSTHEYAALLQGLEASQPYHSLGVEPTVRLSDDELSSVLDVTPHYQSCRWPPNSTRRPPRFIRETVVSEAAGTTHEELLAGPDPAMTHSGGPDSSLLEFTECWLTDVGAYSKTLDNRLLGDAHIRGHPNDTNGPVVLVDPKNGNGATSSPIETAGELIMAANKAVANNSHLLVVTPSPETAEWARGVLDVPYASRLGADSYQLYTVPAAVVTDSGELIITDRESPPAYWSVSGGRQQSLRADSRELASGPLAAPLSSYHFATPRVQSHGDAVAVLHPDGTTRETVSTLVACKADYRFVRCPIAPIEPLFCEAVTVVYRDGSELIEPLRSQDWTDDAGISPRERHFECALETFAETYTFSASADTATPAFFERFLMWYDSHSTHNIPYGSLLTRLLSRQYAVRRDTSGNPAAVEGRRWWISTDDLRLSIAHGSQTTASN